MKYLMVLFLGLLILTGCSLTDVGFSVMSSQDAYELVASGADVVVLDVRSESEFLRGHVAGAMLLPAPTIEAEAERLLLDKEAVILVICQSGNRSRTASRTLANLGYTNVYDIGGIMSWPGEIVN